MQQCLLCGHANSGFFTIWLFQHVCHLNDGSVLSCRCYRCVRNGLPPRPLRPLHLNDFLGVTLREMVLWESGSHFRASMWSCLSPNPVSEGDAGWVWPVFSILDRIWLTVFATFSSVFSECYSSCSFKSGCPR